VATKAKVPVLYLLLCRVCLQTAQSSPVNEIMPSLRFFLLEIAIRCILVESVSRKFLNIASYSPGPRYVYCPGSKSGSTVGSVEHFSRSRSADP
jgi:hypothetical protein